VRPYDRKGHKSDAEQETCQIAKVLRKTEKRLEALLLKV
jgi:hypothetical protein